MAFRILNLHLLRTRETIHDVYERWKGDTVAPGGGGEPLEGLPSAPTGASAGAPAGPIRPWTGRFRPPVQGRISSRFGHRSGVAGRVSENHTGVDFAVPTGTEVRAAADGVVVFAGHRGNYGLTVLIDHGGGMVSLYGHNSALRVSVGQSVTQGTVIALSGNTGRSTGPHVHYELRRNGTPVDPLAE